MGRYDEEEATVNFRRGGKYRSSAKTLLPYRRSKDTGHPVDNAGCCSTILFSWMTRLVWKLYRSAVTVDDLWQTPEADKAIPNAERLQRLWEDELRTKKEEASMKRVIIRFLRTRLLITALVVTICVLCQFASSGIIIRRLLQYVENAQPDLQTGLILIGAMLISETTRAMTFSLAFAISLRSGVRLRSGVTTLVFQKIMRVPPTEKSSVGEIVNMCSSDGDRLFEATYISHFLCTGPVIFSVGTVYLCILVGPIGMIGSGLFFVIMAIQLMSLRYMNRVRQQAVKHTDKRVKAINEVLTYIKLIKMYAWEDSFIGAIHRIRNSEKSLLTRAMVVQSINMSLAWLTPYVATILVLVCSILLGGDISTSEAFTCFALFNSMSFSIKLIPVALKQIAEAGVASDRLESILRRKEFVPYLKCGVSSPENAIELSKANLSWPTDEERDEDEAENSGDNNENVSNVQETKLLKMNVGGSSQDRLCIKKVDLEIEKGTTVGICGKVGSGKSSLLSAMLGHLKLEDGAVTVDGSTAYCAQQAWIMNATIRDNITFGLPYAKQKYDRIVEACCLLPDFEILQSGDLTEVGERGVNMSGGQKQRINIARAIYMDKDIYLLDDPLSAVDAHVGKAIFENAIDKLLKKTGKTIVFVTHRLEYLPYCDQVVLMKNGQVWEIGTHDDLLDNGEEYYNLFKMWNIEKQEQEKSKGAETSLEERSRDDDNITHNSDADKLKRGRLMTVEEKARGAISLQTYALYVKSAGGWHVFAFCLLIFLFYVCCLQFNSFWLSFWLKQGSGAMLNSSDGIGVWNTTDMPILNVSLVLNNVSTFSQSTPAFLSSSSASVMDGGRIIDNPYLYFYIRVFLYAFVATVVTMAIKAVVFSYVILNAAHRLHNNLLDIVLHGTMEFFDTTPAGRILNRFQKDQDMLDSVIPVLWDFVFTFVFIIISCLVFISLAFPYFLLSLIILIPIFLLAMVMFKGAITEMKRLDNITRSPWLSHITTSLDGIYTILSYQRVGNFITKFQELLDRNTTPFFLYASVNRWLVLRLDFLSLSVGMIATILAVFTLGILPPSYAGLAVSSALMLTMLFQFTVRTAVETEANMVCAERIAHYILTVKQEPRGGEVANLNQKWPEYGSVQFKHVKLRYRDGLPLVLNDITFNIDTRDKIGVVGRTGSGKSSLGVALFRLVELVDGEILIDGVNIANLSLRQLRSKISIIPQEPVLFSGTVKYNVDPFSEYKEKEIWLALERTHMKDAISNLPQKLEAPVSENGLNFSVGERQLLCLTRALLRGNKILFLDEATASIDAKTDKLVQHTLNEYFSDCTLITIAHRLHTVLNCDKIMVLDNGSLVEFDTPNNLSQNPDSFFSKLLKSTEV